MDQPKIISYKGKLYSYFYNKVSRKHVYYCLSSDVYIGANYMLKWMELAESAPPISGKFIDPTIRPTVIPSIKDNLF